MADKEAFIKVVKDGYNFRGEKFRAGIAMLDGQPISETEVFIPLKTLNRHGFIAGATGTGKTKTLQVLTEGLSDASVPVVLMDIKGDLSGIAAPGVVNDKIKRTLRQIGGEYKPAGFPVELLTISKEPGVHVRATVTGIRPDIAVENIRIERYAGRGCHLNIQILR